MFYALVNTVDRGAFIFDRIPRTRVFPAVSSKITALELADKLSKHFHYCTSPLTQLATSSRMPCSKLARIHTPSNVSSKFSTPRKSVPKW